MVSWCCIYLFFYFHSFQHMFHLKFMFITFVFHLFFVYIYGLNRIAHSIKALYITNQTTTTRTIFLSSPLSSLSPLSNFSLSLLFPLPHSYSILHLIIIWPIQTVQLLQILLDSFIYHPDYLFLVLLNGFFQLGLTTLLTPWLNTSSYYWNICIITPISLYT